MHRVLREELVGCLEALHDASAPLDARVHEARKHLKKLRALLHLLRCASEPEALEVLERSARLAARSLAGLRGHAALIECFDALVARFPNQLGPLAIGQLRKLLNGAEPNAEDRARSLAVATELLRDAEERVTELLPEDADWAALLPGFRRTYRRARAAYANAESKRKPEAFHAFRTPEKRHLYQVELLERVWPETLSSRPEELDRLGERLGDHHDLSLLRSCLASTSGFDREKARIDVLITRRMKQLERKSLRLGRRLFARKPRAFCRRLE